jgi:hypothetical protein
MKSTTLPVEKHQVMDLLTGTIKQYLVNKASGYEVSDLCKEKRDKGGIKTGSKNCVSK